ncbi:MAG TPA: GNAT family N-acetyltransferase [Candidatus Anoxymicrobiaceae bacterium]
MDSDEGALRDFEELFPWKFVPVEEVFGCIGRGDRLFVGTACGEPQYLVAELNEYARSHARSFFDTDGMRVWTLGVTPYAEDRFDSRFHHCSFFIGDNTREAVNTGLADYMPIFLSQVPDLLARGYVSFDVALVQASLPDSNGYMSLGISVDITKAAIEAASRVICQVNANMPRVHGECFIQVEDVDFIVPHDEPLLEYSPEAPGETARRIGSYVAQIVDDGDTIQVGYGSLPNAIIASLGEKKHLGVHTELLGDGIVDLMKKGVIDNSLKTVDHGKTVASFCMGTSETYEYISDNPSFEFKPIDYTNDPLVIAKNRNMVAINSTLAVDLTGQSTAETIGQTFYSGVGGQADFMRGATLSPGGQTILVLPSTADDGKTSRIVPHLWDGAGVTLLRGDIHYVVTEYGVAYLHGNNIRERAMQLISIAHPSFREWLVEEAKRTNMIYADQAFVPGEEGEYPEELERYRTTRTGLEIFLRPAKLSDESFVKDFFYSLSDKSNYRRFIMLRRYLPHEILQRYIAVDYTKQMVILATIPDGEKELVVGVGQYVIDQEKRTAEIALAVRDEYQARGIGSELLAYLSQIAKSRGLTGFTAEVLGENQPVLNLLEKSGLGFKKSFSDGVGYVNATFKK